MEVAVAEAPPHRRGRLWTQVSAWRGALGDGVGAVAAIRSATVDDPGWDLGWLRLAQHLAASGDRQGALDAVRRAIAIDGDRSESRDLLARLEPPAAGD
jgi:predicted TPR repeat methyltransferase